MDLDGSPEAANNTATFIRTVALSIAFYDYLLTLPAEYRFYKSQRSWRLSMGCALFIAIRYSSVVVMIISNVGYFGGFFTHALCERYYMIAPVFKIFQTMISQLIIGIRTINISRRTKWVTWTIAVSFVSTTAIEWFLNMWHRVPVQGRGHNCTTGNRPPMLTVWILYLLAIAYDLIALGISTMFLVSVGKRHGKMAHLIRIMLTDGLVYFVAITGVNILNVITYRSSDEVLQSSGVSLGTALTWIMSQRILIHLRDAAADHNRSITSQLAPSEGASHSRTRSRPYHPTSVLSVSHAMRSQFESSKERERELDWSFASASVSERRGGGGHRERLSVNGAYPIATASGSGSSTRHGSSKNGEDVESGLGLGVGRGKKRGRTMARGRGRGFEESIDEEDEEDEDKDGFELDVQVRVEETVTVEVEYDAGAYERESYRMPRVMWGRREAEGRSARDSRSRSRTADRDGGAAGT